MVTARCDAGGADELLELSDRVKSSLGEAAVVLGTAENGRPVMVASFTEARSSAGCPPPTSSGRRPG